MVQDCTVTLEIKIRMVCQVNNGVLIRRRAVVNPQLVIEQSVIYRSRDIAGIAFFAVFAEIREVQSLVTLTHIPHALIEPLETAVKMISAVVARKLVFNAVEGEAAPRDAVCVTPD